MVTSRAQVPDQAGAGDDERPVLTEQAGATGWIMLNRPAKRNALSQAMRAGLDQALAGLARDEQVRVVVLTGAGPAFCAGADLSEVPPQAEAPPEAGGRPGTDPQQGRGTGPVGRPTSHPLADRAVPVAQSAAAFGKPLIAAINGPAVGGGLELALACDLRIAVRGATFALPEVRIGSLPGSGGTQRLVRAVGPAIAARMLLTGEPISAEDALRVGLISDLVEPGELTGFAEELAGKIAANAPLSLRAVKQCLAAAAHAQLGVGLELERALWTALATTADRREGRAAFRERRAPRFTGN